MGQICSAIRQIITSWWSVDRIRVSPVEGRLLTLREGQVIGIRNEHYVIGRRTSSHCNEGEKICFLLTGVNQRADLILVRSGTQLATATVVDSNGSFPIFDDDVVLLPDDAA